MSEALALLPSLCHNRNTNVKSMSPTCSKNRKLPFRSCVSKSPFCFQGDLMLQAISASMLDTIRVWCFRWLMDEVLALT